MRINRIHAREILDSRGNPTIEVEVETKMSTGWAAVPSGASTGTYEALELRDKGIRFHGKGVSKAVKNVNKIIFPALKGMVIGDQRKIDQVMLDLDGTHNKKKLGANAILGVSIAAVKAGSLDYKMKLFEYFGTLFSNSKYVLPIPFANVINGGVHAGNELRFQEFMIVPYKAKSFSEAVRMVSEIYHELKILLEESYGSDAINVGDEGGFAPPVESPEEALELLQMAVEEMGYEKKVAYAIDVAASEYYDKKTGKYSLLPGRDMRTDELVDYYEGLVEDFPIISLEDPFAEDDFVGFQKLTKRIGNKIQIVGDDLTVTNTSRIKIGIAKKLCNCLLLKVNQIGTITEAFEAAHLAQKNKWNVMVSHRSGETEDPFIADLAVGIGCGQIKLGAPCRGERTAKYNQLLRIEDFLGKKAVFARFQSK